MVACDMILLLIGSPKQKTVAPPPTCDLAEKTTYDNSRVSSSKTHAKDAAAKKRNLQKIDFLIVRRRFTTFGFR